MAITRTCLVCFLPPTCLAANTFSDCTNSLKRQELAQTWQRPDSTRRNRVTAAQPTLTYNALTGQVPGFLSVKRTRPIVPTNGLVFTYLCLDGWETWAVAKDSQRA